MVDVSVVIPARDAEPTVDRTLSALADQRFEQSFEVILVDDGSQDRTAEIGAKYSGLVRVISHERSRGPGTARNLGVGEARARVLAFTDADCFPTQTWLAKGMEAIARADLVQGRVDPDPTVRRTPFDRSLAVERDGGFYQTANLFVRRETFDAVGGFKDWVLEQRPDRQWSVDRRRGRAARTPIGEDTLFAWSAVRCGARSAFAPDAVVHHAVVPGGMSDDIADRWHWGRDMAGLARLVPELREATFHRRVFFNQVSASFDLAIAGLAAWKLTGQTRWLVAAGPYLRQLYRHARQWGPSEAAAFLAGAPIVDAATLGAFLIGSVSWRSVVL